MQQPCPHTDQKVQESANLLATLFIQCMKKIALFMSIYYKQIPIPISNIFYSLAFSGESTHKRGEC